VSLIENTEVTSLWRGTMQIKPTLAGILAAVAARHGLSVDEIKSESRLKKYTPARQEAAYLMREAGLWSWMQIARAMGRDDHSTAVHHARKYADRMEAAQ